MQILVVEPDDTMQYLLIRMSHALRPKCVLTAVADQSSAIETLDHAQFDIMIVAPHPDESDPLKVVSYARRCYPTLIIVFMTDLIGSYRQEAKAIGVDYFLEKGTSDTPTVLTEALNRVGLTPAPK